MAELEKSFPDLPHRAFWTKVHDLNKLSWDLLDSVKSFPFKSFSELFEIFARPDLFKLYPYLMVNTELLLKSHGLHHPDYLELINGILLISAQAHAEHVPFLIGAMALAYPSQTYAPRGGMRGFFECLEKECLNQGISLHKKSRVTKIQDHKVFINEQSFEFDQVILNVPYWNQAELFDLGEKTRIERDLTGPKEAWGAFTLYMGIPGSREELYQQVHLNHPDVGHYFISFSRPHDEERAPVGWQTVTISTHVRAHEWFGLSQSDYISKKKAMIDLIMTDFQKRFMVSEIKFLTAGTPKTFQNYTHRKFGYVGGLPFLYGMNPFSILNCQTQLPSVYRVGDTIFPGQGLVGVAAGALALDHRIKKFNF
jgi:phytoene dehydrogenase-like protein